MTSSAVLISLWKFSPLLCLIWCFIPVTQGLFNDKYQLRFYYLSSCFYEDTSTLLISRGEDNGTTLSLYYETKLSYGPLGWYLWWRGEQWRSYWIELDVSSGFTQFIFTWSNYQLQTECCWRVANARMVQTNVWPQIHHNINIINITSQTTYNGLKICFPENTTEQKRLESKIFIIEAGQYQPTSASNTYSPSVTYSSSGTSSEISSSTNPSTSSLTTSLMTTSFTSSVIPSVTSNQPSSTTAGSLTTSSVLTYSSTSPVMVSSSANNPSSSTAASSLTISPVMPSTSVTNSSSMNLVITFSSTFSLTMSQTTAGSSSTTVPPSLTTSSYSMASSTLTLSPISIPTSTTSLLYMNTTVKTSLLNSSSAGGFTTTPSSIKIATTTSSALLHTTILTNTVTQSPPTNTVTPSPLTNADRMCVADGVWPQTKAGINITLPNGVKECFNGTVQANRYCSPDGVWGNIICQSSPEFKETLNKIIDSPVDGLDTLSTLFDDISSNEFVFLLSISLETVLATLDNVSTQAFTESFLNASAVLITSASIKRDATREEIRKIGSQLLLTLDSFALNIAEPSGTIELFELFYLKVNEVITEQLDTAANSDVVGIEVDENSIRLPRNIFNETEVRIGSFLFPDLSDLLPPNDTNSSIISPIISSTIDCKTCPVTDLTHNVTIQLKIEYGVSDANYTKENFACAFYDFKRIDGLLPSGDWSPSGCITVSVDGDLVTCSCNHLTHFAILLSPGASVNPKEDKSSAVHYEALNTIGLVLVPISLLCMVMVILTYSLIRSLWSIRNYIHIMLCVSLFMAQLVFIIGVDKIENQDVCSAVAVILLYLFLVTFMWMLMEGVVLYVTLVVVFINNHINYIIGFTVASYVIPAVYMAVIIPIGYLINTDNITDHTHFLYYQEDNELLMACWLNYSTGFIWSFIAPVIVIIMVNIGFFIMSIVIMKKHTRKQKNKKTTAKLRHWLKVSVSLCLVMGIAWLAGVFAFRKELLPISYIITIFIAAQGIMLFIILVVLSKQVREAYTRIWINKKSQSAFLTRISDYTTNISLFSTSSTSTTSRTWNSSSTSAVHKQKGRGHVGGIVLDTFEEPFESSIKEDSIPTITLQKQSVRIDNHADDTRRPKIAEENKYELNSCCHGNSSTVICNSNKLAFLPDGEHGYDNIDGSYEQQSTDNHYEMVTEQYSNDGSSNDEPVYSSVF